MSKRDEAFELFAQGKKPGDPELAALELKRKSIRKYYNQWLYPTPEAAVSVPVGSLQLRQLFTFGGATYRLRLKETSRVHVLLVEWAPSGQYQIERQGKYLPLDTLVIPKAT